MGASRIAFMSVLSIAVLSLLITISSVLIRDNILTSVESSMSVVELFFHGEGSFSEDLYCENNGISFDMITHGFFFKDGKAVNLNRLSVVSAEFIDNIYYVAEDGSTLEANTKLLNVVFQYDIPGNSEKQTFVRLLRLNPKVVN